jgi:hypothetical protein
MIRFTYIILCILIADSSIESLAQSELPVINQRIVNYVRTVIGSTVGRGECWDLADQALTTSGAKFDKSSKSTIYTFGQRYKPDQETILPGDIIQFENVTVSYQDGNMVFNENYKHHTAVVYMINPDQSLKLAHQNTSFGGRKVALSDLDLKNIKKGKLYFYHPIED